MTDIEMAVIALIRKGRANARQSREVAGILDIPERRVRLIIRDLISHGHPILSDTKPPAGYFIAATWTEVMACAANLKTRGLEDLRRRHDILRAARDKVPPEQLELIAK